MDTLPWPETIYHYASPQTLVGIIENECVWATHYGFLNDRKEMLEGCEFFKSLWSDIKEANPKVNAERYDDFDTRIDELIAEIKNFKRDIFIACFSKNPDSLYQ